MRLSFLFLVLGVSVNTFSQKVSNKEYDKLKLAARESADQVFVITADTVKHAGTSLKTEPLYFATSIYFQIDKTKYPRKKKEDIIAWQDKKAYYVYYAPSGYDVVRVMKGKINLYQYYMAEGASGAYGQSSFVHFMFEKSPFNFVPGTFANMEAMFADNPAVLNKYHELYPEETRNSRKWPKQNTTRQEDEIIYNIILLVRMYNEAL